MPTFSCPLYLAPKPQGFSGGLRLVFLPSATAWLAFFAAGQYSRPLPLLPGLLFPPPGSTPGPFRYCLACFFRRRAVLPAPSTTAWLAFSATGQYSQPFPLLPGLLFPPPGSTPGPFRYCLACSSRRWAVLTAPSATAWPALSAAGQYSRPLPLLHGGVFCTVTCLFVRLTALDIPLTLC